MFIEFCLDASRDTPPGGKQMIHSKVLEFNETPAYITLKTFINI